MHVVGEQLFHVIQFLGLPQNQTKVGSWSSSDADRVARAAREEWLFRVGEYFERLSPGGQQNVFPLCISAWRPLHR